MGDVKVSDLEDDIGRLLDVLPVLEYQARLAILDLCIKRLEFEKEQIAQKA
jgi:uncharacterized small protein (DUF1192 family)